MLPLSYHIISKLYDSFFHTITNSKKLNPSKTQWYYVAIIRTIVYKHLPAKFPRRKRNEKLRQKKKKKHATNLLSLFHIKHPAAAHTTKRWPANCCPKTQGKQWHPGSSTSSNFLGAVLCCQFNNIWKKKSISLFFLSLFFLLNFFDNLDLKKTIIKKCLKQIVG